MLAHAVKHGYYLSHLDVETAFLYGDCDTEFYLQQPPGADDGSGRVCRMHKTLYGLRQAGRSWYLKLHSALIALGFRPGESDQCLYVRCEEGAFIALTIWVDDIVVAAERADAAEKLTAQLSKHFSMKNLGNLSWCLGMRVNYDRKKGTLELDQS